jgi:hypothetical protein
LYSGFTYGAKTTFVRQLFVPDESERSCGPSTKEDWVAYRLDKNALVLESEDDEESPIDIDSLYNIWKSATVANDTLRTDSTESK